MSKGLNTREQEGDPAQAFAAALPDSALDSQGLAQLIEFFKVLDGWDRESEDCQ